MNGDAAHRIFIALVLVRLRGWHHRLRLAVGGVFFDHDVSDAKVLWKNLGESSKVVGFDIDNRTILKSVEGTFFETVQVPKITLGLRKIPIREDYTKYKNNKQRTSASNFKTGLLYSDYDDTDLNPNIIVNYLNR